MFGIQKGPECLYQPFDFLLKQVTCEMKALQVGTSLHSIMIL